MIRDDGTFELGTARHTDAYGRELVIKPPPAGMGASPVIVPTFDLSKGRLAPFPIVATTASGTLEIPTSAPAFAGTFNTFGNVAAASRVLVNTIRAGSVFRVFFSAGYGGTGGGALLGYIANQAAVTQQAVLFGTRLPDGAGAGFHPSYRSPWLLATSDCRFILDTPLLGVSDVLTMGYGVEVSSLP